MTRRSAFLTPLLGVALPLLLLLAGTGHLPLRWGKSDEQRFEDLLAQVQAEADAHHLVVDPWREGGVLIGPPWYQAREALALPAGRELVAVVEKEPKRWAEVLKQKRQEDARPHGVILELLERYGPKEPKAGPRKSLFARLFGGKGKPGA